MRPHSGLKALAFPALSYNLRKADSNPVVFNRNPEEFDEDDMEHMKSELDVSSF